MIPKSVAIGLSQPIFRGFKTINGTKAAEANVEAGKQSLLAIEQDILFQAIQAYMNVIRDRQIVGLRQQNVGVLQKQLTAADERFKVGEITRTDVAQSRASRQRGPIERGVGQSHAGGQCCQLHQCGGAPARQFEISPACQAPQNPGAGAGRCGGNQSQHSGCGLCGRSFDLQYRSHKRRSSAGGKSGCIGISSTTTPQSARSRSESARIEGVLTIPLYEAGRVYSSVREAKHVASQRRLEVIQAGRSVRESVSISWNNLTAAREIIRSAKSQVSAAALALDGVRQEYLVGSRTTLDVLDAETEVVSARIALVSAERDQIVAAYQILGSIGRLTARDLSLPVEYYDADENYLNVRGKWFGTGADTIE